MLWGACGTISLITVHSEGSQGTVRLACGQSAASRPCTVLCVPGKGQQLRRPYEAVTADADAVSQLQLVRFLSLQSQPASDGPTAATADMRVEVIAVPSAEAESSPAAKHHSRTELHLAATQQPLPDSYCGALPEPSRTSVVTVSAVVGGDALAPSMLAQVPLASQ